MSSGIEPVSGSSGTDLYSQYYNCSAEHPYSTYHTLSEPSSSDSAANKQSAEEMKQAIGDPDAMPYSTW